MTAPAAGVSATGNKMIMSKRHALATGEGGDGELRGDDNEITLVGTSGSG